MFSVIALVVGVVAVLLVLRQLRGPATEEMDPDDARVFRVAVELHAIRRRLDIVWTRTQLGIDTARLRRELQRELADDDPSHKS